MAYFELDLFVDAGADFSATLPWSGALASGQTAALAVRITPADAAPALAVTTTPGASGGLTMAAGTITVAFTPAGTGSAGLGLSGVQVFSYELDVTTTAGGKREPVYKGNVYLSPQVNFA